MPPSVSVAVVLGGGVVGPVATVEPPAIALSEVTAVKAAAAERVLKVWVMISPSVKS